MRINFLRNRPTLVDENCFTLIKNILLYFGWNKNYKLINVTPGLAKLIKKEGFNVRYNEINKIAYINPTIKEEKIKELSCTEENLSKIYCEIKRKQVL